MTYNDFISPVCLPVNVNYEQSNPPNRNDISSTLFGRGENEILQGPGDENEKRKGEMNGSNNAESSNSYGSGVVVGWGAIEKYGDNGASRGFLKELNKKKFAVVRNERNLTQVIKMAGMDDVLRLRKVELPFIDRFTCERWYASRGRPIRLIDRQFCAGLYEGTCFIYFFISMLFNQMFLFYYKGGKDACRVRH